MRLLVQYGANINFVGLPVHRHRIALSIKVAAETCDLGLGASLTVRENDNYHLAFEFTGTGLIAFAEMGIYLPALCLDHVSLWPDAETK